MSDGNTLSTVVSAGETTGFGHGKVILLGEHTVVFGHPAIAVGLALGVRARLHPGNGRIRAPSWSVDARVGDDSPLGTAVAQIFGRLRVASNKVDVWLDARIPCGGGLGSSAATAVAIARAAAVRSRASIADVEAAIMASEAVFHSNPSGVDTAVAARGGVGVFVKGVGWRPATMPRGLELCIGFSGKPRSTRNMVEAVAELYHGSPAAKQLVEDLGEVTRSGLDALAAGDIPTLGRLFDVAHSMLRRLTLSTAELETLVDGARAAGALGAKLTGAGGGGAVIALAPSGRMTTVLSRWRADGFEGMVAEVAP